MINSQYLQIIEELIINGDDITKFTGELQIYDYQDNIFKTYLAVYYVTLDDFEASRAILLDCFLTTSLGDNDKLYRDTISIFEYFILLFKQNQNYVKAKLIYDFLIDFFPSYKNETIKKNVLDGLFCLAESAYSQQEFQLSLEVCNIINELESNLHQLNYLRAKNYIAIKLYDNALNCFNLCVKSDPQNLKYHLGIFDLYLKCGWNKKVEIILEDIYHKYCYDYQVLNLFGNICIDNSSYFFAIRLFTHIANNSLQYSINENIFSKLAHAYHQLGNERLSHLYNGYENYYHESPIIAEKYFDKYLAYAMLDDPQALFIIAHCYTILNNTNSAGNLLILGVDLFPLDLFLKRLHQSLLPIIYESQEDILIYRKRYISKFNNFINFVNSSSSPDYLYILKSICCVNDFYLAYQGKNDKGFLRLFGKFVHHIISNIYPDFIKLDKVEPLCLSGNHRRVRLGFATCRLLDELYLGWIQKLNKFKFEIFFYDLYDHKNSPKEKQKEAKINFKNVSDHYECVNAEVLKIASKIKDDKIDVLIYPESNLDTLIVSLSCLRLAPVQCTTWSHPMTSGIPSIDYFLSSDLMEQFSADHHYSEKLIRLPNLGFSLQKPRLPQFVKSREDFNLPINKTIYLCCQTLFKYLPNRDYIFAEIATRVPNALFIFFDSFLGGSITSQFADRLGRAFCSYNLDINEYCLFFPKLPFNDYLNIHFLCDVFLDSFDWSGGMTSRDAIACGLPIVTCPGRLMRSRQSYGMLRMIGVSETIASSEEEYIEIATSLGNISEWNKLVRAKILNNNHRLFNDEECILGLENFLLHALK